MQSRLPKKEEKRQYVEAGFEKGQNTCGLQIMILPFFIHGAFKFAQCLGTCVINLLLHLM